MLYYIFQAAGDSRFRLGENDMKCIQCGVNVPDSTAFCPNCGSRLRSAVLSPKPETFKFSCEICGQHISVPKVWSGRLAVCPSCNQRVRIPRPDSGCAAAAHPEPPPAVVVPPAPRFEASEKKAPESPASTRGRAVPKVEPLPPPPPRTAPLQPSLLNVSPEPPEEKAPEENAAGRCAIPELPPDRLAAGKRRNLMAGAAGIGILFCLLAVLGAVGIRLYRNAASSRPADLELFRRIGTACTIYCVDFQGAFPDGEGVVGFQKLVDQQCLERGLLLAGDTVFFERNLKVAYVGGGQREGAPDCGLLPVAFDKPRFAGKSIRVLRSNGVISLVEFSGKKQSCAEFAEFLRQSTPGPEDAWALVLENARAIDFADGL